MQTLKTILSATDFSPLSTDALHAALALALAHEARLILLYVKQSQETVQGEFGLVPTEPEATDTDISIKMGEMLPNNSLIKVERLVMPGNPEKVIVEVAKEKGCDLIVLGSHGRKGLARLIYGNVADRVARSAPCPVLALRSAQTEAEESERTL